MSSYIGAAKRTITDGRRRPYVPTTVADGCRSDGLGRAPLLLPRPLLDPLSSEGRNGIPFPKEKDFSSPPRSYPAHLTFERNAIVENDNRLGIYVGPFLSTLTAFPLSLPEETFLASFLFNPSVAFPNSPFDPNNAAAALSFFFLPSHKSRDTDVLQCGKEGAFAPYRSERAFVCLASIHPKSPSETFFGCEVEFGSGHLVADIQFYTVPHERVYQHDIWYTEKLLLCLCGRALKIYR